MAYIRGNDIKITIGTQIIGGQQGCSLNKETKTSDVTTKDSGVWSEEEAVGLSWSVDCDGLIVVGDEGLKALNNAWKTLASVDVKIGTAGNFQTGKAIIESLSENSPQQEKCTYSVTLKGLGKLTDGQGDDDESDVGPVGFNS